MQKSLLDPDDWEDFRSQAHAVLDACVDRLINARDFPWRPVSPGSLREYPLPDAGGEETYRDLAGKLVTHVLPFATGNTHPRFFGWVHGTGLAAGLLTEMVAATMNSNCGGRDHAATYIERAVVDWCRRVFGFPETASGILVTGTSQATLVALAVARTRALGVDVRRDGVRHAPWLTAYAVEGVHSAVVKALEVLGLGSSALRVVPRSPHGGMDLHALAELVSRDSAAGARPFCVIGTAGSVDLGEFDDLHALADFCAGQGLWFHVDGAFGAWTRLARSPWRDMTDGLQRADSVAFDFHKWMYVQYDCGAVLVRDRDMHRATFAARPSYLAGQEYGLGGGEPWYCDYGTDLSRGFRALKAWAAIKVYGTSRMGSAITRNCQLAALMGKIVEESDELSLCAPVRSNVCCFSASDPDMGPEEGGMLNKRIVESLQVSGEAVFSTTQCRGSTVIRAAIVNHRTCEDDIRASIGAVRKLRAALRDKREAGPANR
ncbi:MAG: pyridoxal phosphate-dependent decarboxylase family protein [Thermodesulfobacteriota bacterium]